MTVNELIKALEEYKSMGHGDLKVIANCRFEIEGELYDRYMCNLEDVYYQSGDIELGFNETQEEY